MNPKSIILSSLGVIFAAYLYISFFSSEATASAPASATQNVYAIKNVMRAEQNKLPDFTWVDETGTERSFHEETKGKVVFFNIWGTWCPPCRREIPDIIKLSKDLKDENFVVIGLALEKASVDIAKNKVATYAKSKGIPYINFVNESQMVAALGGVNAVPTTIITDVNGKISEKIVGGRNYADFKRSIDKAMTK